MKLPSQKRILREDVKDAPNWINGIIDPVNSFMQSVYQALSKNITFSENIAAFIRELDYTTPSTYPAGVDNIEFTNTLKTRAIGVMVVQVYEKTTYTAPAGPVYVPWIENNGTIIISTITGLAASKSYVVRLIVI